jgi:hypothetical protein
MIALPVTDDDGFPVQTRGVSAFPGLFFVGLPWLHTAKSGLIFGVIEDARYIADRIAARRDESEDRRAPVPAPQAQTAARAKTSRWPDRAYASCTKSLFLRGLGRCSRMPLRDAAHTAPSRNVRSPFVSMPPDSPLSTLIQRLRPPTRSHRKDDPAFCRRRNFYDWRSR